jgi:hypothetical protein
MVNSADALAGNQELPVSFPAEVATAFKISTTANADLEMGDINRC